MSTSSLPAQEPDNQGNPNLHLTDSLLVFGFGSERLAEKSYGAALHFSLRLGHFSQCRQQPVPGVPRP